MAGTAANSCTTTFTHLEHKPQVVVSGAGRLEQGGEAAVQLRLVHRKVLHVVGDRPDLLRLDDPLEEERREVDIDQLLRPQCHSAQPAEPKVPLPLHLGVR